MIKNFVPQGFSASHQLCHEAEAEDYLFYLADNKIFLLENKQLPRGRDLDSLKLPPSTELYCFGHYQQKRCLLISALSAENSSTRGLLPQAIKLSHEALGEDLFRLSGLASQLHHWRSTHIFCGHCGRATQDKPLERAKFCSHCHLDYYPQLYPCIIVIVTRGQELLLARSPAFSTGVYSTLAGFVEPGESVEDAVAREVMEEVQLKVKNIRYLCSQPWPFPNNLMLGFRAEYESGEICVDKRELEDAQWFRAESLPPLTSSLSISRFLIEQALQSLPQTAP